MTELKWALNSAKRWYDIFIVCSLFHTPRQLFHTFSSLLKHYLPRYPHFPPATKISMSRRKLTISRHLPKLPLPTYHPCSAPSLLLLGQLSAPVCHLSLAVCTPFLFSYSRASPRNSPLSLTSLISHYTESFPPAYRHVVTFHNLKENPSPLISAFSHPHVPLLTLKDAEEYLFVHSLHFLSSSPLLNPR